VVSSTSCSDGPLFESWLWEWLSSLRVFFVFIIQSAGTRLQIVHSATQYTDFRKVFFTLRTSYDFTVCVCHFFYAHNKCMSCEVWLTQCLFSQNLQLLHTFLWASTSSPRFTPGMRCWTNQRNRNRRKLKRFYDVNQWEVNDVFPTPNHWRVI
jgi:hypothetical protein